MSSVLVETIEKSRIDELRVALSEYRDRFYIDVRLYTELSDSPEKVPTKRGINLRVEQLPELIEALERARAVAVERGLLKRDAA